MSYNGSGTQGYQPEILQELSLLEIQLVLKSLSEGILTPDGLLLNLVRHLPTQSLPGVMDQPSGTPTTHMPGGTNPPP